MHYAGSKSKVRGITLVIQSFIPHGGIYWEPFVGAGRMIERINNCRRYGSDLDVHIIDLLKAMQNGWQPPGSLSEKEYQHWMKVAKTTKTRDPMIAFVGYGCSFGGVFFGGYARCEKGVNKTVAAIHARNQLLSSRRMIQGVELRVRNYTKGLWIDEQPDVIYADPPYEGTRKVGGLGGFDNTAFWKWCQQQAGLGSVVLVSEYICPIGGARVIWERQVRKSLRATDGTTHKVERLYCIGAGTNSNIGFGY